jgi:hypothetical protein
MTDYKSGKPNDSKDFVQGSDPGRNRCRVPAYGCASIVNGTSQVISVETRIKGEPVAGASCKLQNDKGVFYVTTPGTVNVHRAYGDLAVRCEK